MREKEGSKKLFFVSTEKNSLNVTRFNMLNLLSSSKRDWFLRHISRKNATTFADRVKIGEVLLMKTINLCIQIR